MVTQADIDALEKVIASGVLRVRYADRDVTYQSTQAMQDALADMKRELAKASGKARTHYVAVIDRGV